MSTYQRSDVHFPAGTGSLFTLVNATSGDLSAILLNNTLTLANAFLSGSGIQIDLNLGDGTTLRMHGSWSTNTTVTTVGVTGTVTSFERISGGDVLETVNDFSADFSFSYNLFNGGTTSDFSSFAGIVNGDDHVYGGALRDLLKGFAGDDTLSGLAGKDKLFGGSGDDMLLGGGGNDTLLGGSGKDVLDGRAGNDKLTGGNGPDTFFFANRFGHDTITDFSANNHEDIDLSHVTAITGFFDLVHHHLSTGAGGWAEIDVGTSKSILLHGITVSEIGHGLAYSGADFIF